MKKPLPIRRLDAIYEYYNYATRSRRDELLTYFLATVSHKQIKEAVEYFNIKVN